MTLRIDPDGLDAAQGSPFTRLRRMTQRDVALADLALVIPGRTHLTLGTASATIAFPGRCTLPGDAIACEAWIGDHVFEVYVPMDAIAALIAAHGFDADPSTLKSETLAIVVQWLLQDVMAPFEAALGGAFCVLEAAPGLYSGRDAALEIDVLGLLPNPFAVAIFGASTSFARIAEATRRDRRRLSDAIEVPLSYRIFGFSMPQAEIAAMVAGDALLMPDNWQPDAVVQVCADGLLNAQVTDEGDVLSIESIAPHKTSRSTRPMKDTSELPVEIGVEVAREPVTLERLQELVAGQILPLPTMSEDTVRLIAFGRPVATGEIVAVDEGYAIRILEID